MKSTSLDKRAAHSGVTAHTFSSSLKQKIDKKNQQAILQKYQGRGKAAKVTDGQVNKNTVLSTGQDRVGSQERQLMPSLATDRSDRMQTQRRKKTERAQGDKGDMKSSESFLQKSRPRDPMSGTAKKIKQATAARNPAGAAGSNNKQVKLGRQITSDMSSKQAVNSPAKGSNAPNITTNKFGNQYVADLKRQSLKEPISGSALASSLLADSNPPKFGQNMKQTEIVALKEGRLDTSAGGFDTNEMREDAEKEDSGEQMIEQPMENIDDVSMAISHIKTPKKVSDMRSKPGGTLKGKKKKTSNFTDFKDPTNP